MQNCAYKRSPELSHLPECALAVVMSFLHVNHMKCFFIIIIYMVKRMNNFYRRFFKTKLSLIEYMCFQEPPTSRQIDLIVFKIVYTYISIIKYQCLHVNKTYKNEI